MRFYILTVIFSLLSLATVCAQRQTVTGKLFTVEEQADEALPYAEVTVLSLPDSALVRGTVTKTDGSFMLNYTRKQLLLSLKLMRLLWHCSILRKTVSTWDVSA